MSLLLHLTTYVNYLRGVIFMKWNLWPFWIILLRSQ
jgi:hypothetical protein